MHFVGEEYFLIVYLEFAVPTSILIVLHNQKGDLFIFSHDGKHAN